ncbi:hypothetical protein BT63DRAFT_440877 [Microthyrium microscopicum]|uniref:Uncharacterized protein n=1 Tax=Microthyrium microscopicum TaxID=703497 RepID=A0A6A6UBH1_9PEZI|nr:hypothetical protein BT63DRAFT_440877 [Microthyrium microscopicum]
MRSTTLLAVWLSPVVVTAMPQADPKSGMSSWAASYFPNARSGHNAWLDPQNDKTCSCPPLKSSTPSLIKPANCPDPKTIPNAKGTLKDNECLVGGIMGGDFFNPCYAPDLRNGLGPGSGGRSVSDWSGGSGPHKAQFFTDPSLPNHTIYAPKTPVTGKKLPLLVWANGACESDGSAFSNFLTEIASHGFIVLANGKPSKVWGKGGFSMPGGEKSRAAQLTKSIDWAEKGGAAKFGEIDMSNVAVAGQSCGGVEAYSASVYEPRVKLIGIFNTGVIDPARRWMLKDIKQPIGYFYGGKVDFSESFITQDFREIPASLPAMMSSLPVGHGGTFSEANGGKFGKAAVAFFKWNLQGDAASKDLYFNKTSALYKDGWTIDTAHWTQK